jgi:signal peptidase I
MDVEPDQPDNVAESSASPAGAARSADANPDASPATVSIEIANGGSAANGAARNGSSPDGSSAGSSATGDDTPEGSAAEGSAAEGGATEGDEGSETEGGPTPARPKRKRSFWRELGIVVVAALVLTILIKAFLVQVFSIPSGSMENTLQVGDRILVNRLVYHLRGIARGDVVVFSGDGSWGPPPPPPPGNPVLRAWDDFTNLVGVSAPGTDYVKRVIGLPGDHVVCCNAQGDITVNGVALREQGYLYPGDQPNSNGFTSTYNVVVPAGRLFVLGDHRSDSADSRWHTQDGYDGTIPESAVVGRAFVIIWPPSRIGDLPIPSTFQQAGFNAAAAAVSYGPAAGGASAAAGVLVWRRRRRCRDLDVPACDTHVRNKAA